MKEMLETGGPPPVETVKHIDRCLSCLSCMSTCPAGVDYMRLVDQTRVHIEATFRRPWQDRWLRRFLGWVLVRPPALRIAMSAGGLARWFAALMPPRLAVLARLSPGLVGGPAPVVRAGRYPPKGERRMRVALLTGCVQSVTGTEIHEATVRLLRRHGCEVVITEGAGCCGALNLHLGDEHAALQSAERSVRSWWREIQGHGLDAIVIKRFRVRHRDQGLCTPVPESLGASRGRVSRVRARRRRQRVAIASGIETDAGQIEGRGLSRCLFPPPRTATYGAATPSCSRRAGVRCPFAN